MIAVTLTDVKVMKGKEVLKVFAINRSRSFTQALNLAKQWQKIYLDEGVEAAESKISTKPDKIRITVEKRADGLVYSIWDHKKKVRSFSGGFAKQKAEGYLAVYLNEGYQKAQDSLQNVSPYRFGEYHLVFHKNAVSVLKNNEHLKSFHHGIDSTQALARAMQHIKMLRMVQESTRSTPEESHDQPGQ